MAEAEALGSHAEHPAPARGEVHLATLAFGVLGAPVVWGAHLLANVTIASRACNSLTTYAPSTAAHTSLLLIDVVALIVALGALLTSTKAWRSTRHGSHGQQDHGQGSAPEHDAAQVGEGRTRFIALAGMIMSVLFVVAILFDTFAAVMVTTCGK